MKIPTTKIKSVNFAQNQFKLFVVDLS